MRQALVVDDHPIVRGGIKDFLQQVFPTILIKTSSGAAGALEEVCGYPWAFVVLDLNLHGHNGIDLLKKASARRPDLPIIVFSSFLESQYATRSLRAGARAYLSKGRPPADLVDAVKLVLQGKATKRRADTTQPALSAREIQVLTCFGKGMSAKEVAVALHLSGKTIATYKGRLLSKLGLRSQAELIRYANEERLV